MKLGVVSGSPARVTMMLFGLLAVVLALNGGVTSNPALAAPTRGGAATLATLTLPEQQLAKAISLLLEAGGAPPDRTDRSLRAADEALTEALAGLGYAPAALQSTLDALAVVRLVDPEQPPAARAAGLRVAIEKAQQAFLAIRRDGLAPLAGQAITVEPGGLQFGVMCVGEVATLTFTVTNKTAVARQVDFGGLGTDSVFFLDSGLPATLGPGESTEVTIRCAPTRPVELSKAIRLAAPGVGGEPDAGVFVSMSVNAYPVKIEPNPVEFGEVQIGQSRDLTLTLTNCLDTPFKSKIGIEATQGAFTWVNQPAPRLKFELAGRASVQLTVRFTPTSAADFTAYINIDMNSLRPIRMRDLRVPLHGLGKQPISVGPSKIDFGVVPRNQFQNRSFTIANDTDEATQVQVDGSKLPSVYFLVSPSGPVKVAPHSSTPVNIRFGSTGACKHKGKVFIMAPGLPGGKANVSVAVQAR